MGTSHGSRTGKKSRKKRMTLKALQGLKNALSQRQNYTDTSDKEKKKRVMNFDDFKKDDINTIKR